jgi:hypothetical protein
VKQTAKAFVKVRQIVYEANRDISSTTDKARQQQIAKQAEAKKMSAVKAEGLQPQQYNQSYSLLESTRPSNRSSCPTSMM